MTGKRKRRALQEVVRLRSELEEVAQCEEVREGFDVLDKQGVPLRKQPPRATPEVIEERKVEQFKKLLPADMLEVLDLVDDEPPATGSRTTRALGRMAEIVDKAQEHSRLTRSGLVVNQELHRLIAALAKFELRKGSRNKTKDADAYLQRDHPRIWRDVWIPLSSSRRREIMIESQRIRATKPVMPGR